VRLHHRVVLLVRVDSQGGNGPHMQADSIAGLAARVDFEKIIRMRDNNTWCDNARMVLGSRLSWNPMQRRGCGCIEVRSASLLICQLSQLCSKGLNRHILYFSRVVDEGIAGCCCPMRIVPARLGSREQCPGFFVPENRDFSGCRSGTS
jgi:hypothetical protein